MRALAWFVAAVAGTLVLAALLGYPVWRLTQALGADWPFHKVTSRLWQLLLLGGIVLAVRRLGLGSRADWGYGQPRAQFLRHAGAGLAIGLATMLPMSLAMTALGILEPGADLDAVSLLRYLAAGAAIGIAVAAVEETFFRGLMYRGITRESGLAAAVGGTALFYSAIHFLARARIGHDQIGWGSGFELMGVALSRFAQPASIADAFVTLALVGVLLALLRHRTGGIAAGIGLHTGWICVIKATKWSTTPAPDSPWSFLVGSFDGYTGWLVAGWAALLLLAGLAFGWLRPAGSATAARG
ncbi:MAG TPA: CPBP family glutamic-type intramembrane protease [Steroidobacteraceae bacterium]|nr:CPBP family glutamic-type intramembrane protease [Steroidobacteraceae bacterium]